MGRIISSLCILMIFVMHSMAEGDSAESCIPVYKYCGNFGECCPTAKEVNGELKRVETICDITQTNRYRLCMPVDEVESLLKVIEHNERILRDNPRISLGSNMPNRY
ncbi:hypothetical protein [Cotesia plutellae polydnavirus]|nr:hypothetical protein [Cotesia plutellae polydnavirus]AEE09458.1 conserved hypothetical protein [Cotesia vestalis bracovirus]